jgi:DNA uptake protein ComE-like DNA-binding protein
MVALLIGFYSCQTSEQNQSESSEEPVVESETAVSDEAPTAAMLNFNMASEQELVALGLSSEMVTSIVDQRPFLSMTDLDKMIGDQLDSANKVALYNKAFIPFNLNTTPEDNFKIIPGVGNKMAHEFEEYRPYIKIEQFRREIGKYVDETEVARLEQYVFVPVELNTATKEEILAIPGVGDKMLHEFEEYRPYQNMEQFRREIGKYVDDKELARLERFVYIKE